MLETRDKQSSDRTCIAPMYDYIMLEQVGAGPLPLKDHVKDATLY